MKHSNRSAHGGQTDPERADRLFYEQGVIVTEGYDVDRESSHNLADRGSRIRTDHLDEVTAAKLGRGV